MLNQCCNAYMNLGISTFYTVWICVINFEIRMTGKFLKMTGGLLHFRIFTNEIKIIIGLNVIKNTFSTLKCSVEFFEIFCLVY